MIELPRRSVTRFFIPLIDVLTLLFCIFLLMPVVKPSDNTGEADASPAAELERLRRDRVELMKQLQDIREDKIQALQQHLAVRVLEIDGTTGKLYYYDAAKAADRRTEITAGNVKAIIGDAQRDVRGEDVYFLLMYPRPASGDPLFPEQRQKNEFERWFSGVAHGYDIPRQTP